MRNVGPARLVGTETPLRPNASAVTIPTGEAVTDMHLPARYETAGPSQTCALEAILRDAVSIPSISQEDPPVLDIVSGD